MVFTKQYAWKASSTQQSLLTLIIPNCAEEKPTITVHPCTVTLDEAAELAEAARAAVQIGSGFFAKLPPHATN
jgi:hypothetical protein